MLEECLFGLQLQLQDERQLQEGRGARLKEGTGSYSDLLGRAKWPGCLGRQRGAEETS